MANVPNMTKPTTFWGFRLLPAELRLRVLRNTDLGRPDTGGYDKDFECLRIRDGKIIPIHHPLLDPRSVCSYKVTHGKPTQRCQCRILPTQLFLVDQQMRREAIEVFYHDAYFDLYNEDLASTLSFLRDVIPREGLGRLRRIKFSMTEAQCEGWAGGAVDSGYSAAMLETQVAVPYWGGGPAPRRNHKADWRAVVALLSERANLPRLTISVEMGECAWTFVEDTLIWPDPPDLSMFRFIYDFYMDVATAMCALNGLGGLDLELGVFQQLRPWLEREVLGYARERAGLSPRARRLEQDLWRRPRFYQVVPPWHDANQRLEVSNYHNEC